MWGRWRSRVAWPSQLPSRLNLGSKTESNQTNNQKKCVVVVGYLKECSKRFRFIKKKKKMNRNQRWRHKWIKYWTNQNAEADLEVDLEVGGQLNCPPHMQGIVWCFLSLRWMNVLVRDFSVKGLKGIEKQNTRAHTHTHTHTRNQREIFNKKKTR